MLSEASAKREDNLQRLVVRPRPVHRLNSLMREEADLKGYEAYICGCADVAEKLYELGLLRADEKVECKAYFAPREGAWPNAPAISDGAILYLDDVALGYLQQTGLLSRLSSAGFVPIVSESAVAEAVALISYDTKTNEIAAHVEALRIALRNGISAGQIHLGGTFDHGEDDVDRLSQHPTSQFLHLINEVDAGVCDDRFLNQHQNMTNDDVTRPLLSTLDVLEIFRDRGALSNERWIETLATLRQRGFSFVPLSEEELSRHVKGAVVKNGQIVETAELRAIREHLRAVQMCDVLQIPKEAAWLDSITISVLETLAGLWNSGRKNEESVAIANWLVELADIRGWAHSIREAHFEVQSRYARFVWLLVSMSFRIRRDTKMRYQSWLDDTVIQPMRASDHLAFEELCALSKNFIDQMLTDDAAVEDEIDNKAR